MMIFNDMIISEARTVDEKTFLEIPCSNIARTLLANWYAAAKGSLLSACDFLSPLLTF
jgi:hypothetical protein